MAGIRPENLRTSDIKSRLLNLAQTSLYRLTIPVPSKVSSLASSRGITSFDVDNISLMCAEANLPGSSLATHDVTNDYHGVSEKMVYRRMYDETADMTFYVDREYKVVDFFESWIDYITGVTNRQTFENPYVNHRVAYANDYKVNFYLTKFEKDHHYNGSTRTLDYTFVHGFPISITAMPVSYDQSQILRCNVSFSFIRYTVSRSLDFGQDSGTDNTGLFQKVSSNLNENPLSGNSPDEIIRKSQVLSQEQIRNRRLGL